MRTLAACIAICLAGPATAEPDAFFGKSGEACLQELVEAAGPAGSRDIFALAIEFQSCVAASAVLGACGWEDLGRCSFGDASHIAAARYAAAARQADLPGTARGMSAIVITPNRPAKWAGCLSDYGAGGTVSGDLRDMLMAEAIALSACTAIFAMIDIAVIDGMALIAEDLE